MQLSLRLMVSLIVLVSTNWSIRVFANPSIEEDYPYLKTLYEHLHSHPELSFQEQATAQRIGDELESIGFTVTRNFGGHGVVGLLKNGTGPTVMIRTDLDALPIKEQTGLSYASNAKAVDIDGIEKNIMHACGHDVHMTSFVGTARQLSNRRQEWKGTLVMIGQPAEERGAGAVAMLEQGLFEKFPRPDFNLALHGKAGLAAGTVAYVPGAAFANVDSVDILVFGIGGHGAYPHTTKDPIVLSAQIINALQTIVSREIDPQEPAVVTVGSIHGGSKHNIIPEQVKLQLTIRSYSLAVRNQTIAAIKQKVKGLALAFGLPEDKLPVVTLKDEFTPVTFNNQQLTMRLLGVFEKLLGKDKVILDKPVMGGEDFGRYGQVEPKIPSLMFRLGMDSAEKINKTHAQGKKMPSLHSPLFAPDDPKLTITTGVKATTAAVLDLLNGR